MTYIIGNKEYNTKKDITEYFSDILKKSKQNAKLEGSVLENVTSLIKLHPEAEEKIGCGIDSIVIEKHINILTGYPDKYPHFHIYRTDGTNIDFSYIKCISSIKTEKTRKLSEHYSEVKKAMRFVIKPQINSFRKEAFGKKEYLKCPILNINFSKKTCNVDHEPPFTFDQLTYNFMLAENLKFSDIKILHLNGIYKTIQNEDIRSKWYNYHLNNAKLRVVHEAGNKSQSKSSIDWTKLK